MEFSYEDLKPLNPRLVMCSISVSEQTGPLSHLPGFDYIAQAYADITKMIGEPTQSPIVPTTSMGDVSTGVHALAALEQEYVPVAPVLTIPEVMQQPHFLERGAVRSVSDRVFGTLRLPGFPFLFSPNASRAH